ncbi:MAG TPA: non-heme iron oxygenase ferredoxin subunit [Euzebya sp.]|nr:non-heme iron oxygenase ferredoxin subunit [Euzebya sp.]
MSEFTRVASVAEVPPGHLHRAEVAGQAIVLANVDGTLYAVGAECTHDDGPLDEGELEDGCVRCPWHFSLFDLATGEVIESPAPDPIPTYAVQVDGDDILVAVGG